ncbi:MAG: hypothetical protein CMG26_00575 [Candidatus Marinimicrobia bacterium]|nr:hypothetical protein [Candidatus Neomarinimicrobiota bacterium]
MKSLKYYFSIFILTSLFFSQSEQPYPPLDLVTIPTSGTLPKGSFTLESLLIKDGGIVPKLSVGITDNFYIGLSYGIQDFIGEEKLNFNKPMPEIQIKYRIYQETETIPAIVLGLDTQGKGRFLTRYQSGNNDIENFARYEQKAWGWYLVASKNWDLAGNTGIHIGLNRNTWETDPVESNNPNTIFKDNDLNLFFGLDKELNRSFSLLLEYDFALNDNDPEIGYDLFGKGKGYLNAGLRWMVGKNIMLEIDFNDISKNYVNDQTPNNEKEYSNRELKIIYFEKF